MAAKLGACDPFVYHLRRSYLLDRGRLDQVLTDFMKDHPLDPAVLADYLIGQEILTQYQAERLLQGKFEYLVLGPYTVIDEIGFGSMGPVYKARSKNDPKRYAVKLMPRRSMWNVRIAKRLVRSFGHVDHPAVVAFVDVNTVGGNLCLVWPFVEGETLEHLVERKGRLLPGVAAWFALQAAEGLAVCHRQGLIHGLLKPANFLVRPNQQIRILDFGTGALLSEAEGAELVDTMSTANAVTSGLDCRSPENILDPKIRTAAGDQYSLGCVLYFCLTGRYPFAGETAVEKMLAHQVKEPTPIRTLRPEVPQALADVVQRLMHKTPEGRYSNLDEMIDVLRPLAVTPEVASRLLGMEIPDSPKPEAKPEANASAANSQSERQQTASPFTPSSPGQAAVVTNEVMPSETPFAFQASPTIKKRANQFKNRKLGRSTIIWTISALLIASGLLAFVLWLTLNR
jgi:serine/threonine-protein kinase